LKEGDVAKIICGAHIDGYAANAAVTIVVGDAKVDGRKADVILAAHNALKAAERVIRDQGTNAEVTAAINKVVAEYDCNALEGVLSHIVKKYCIDGNKAIIGKEVAGQQVEEWTFVPGEFIHLDIYVSSGEGKPKLAEHRTTVFKRELQNMYNLKIQKSRAFFSEVNKRFPTLPFALRAFEDQTGAKVGIRECIDHELLQPYPVLIEKDGEYVAHFKSTVIVLAKSTQVIAGNLPFEAARYEASATKSIQNEEVKSLVNKDLWKKQ